MISKIIQKEKDAQEEYLKKCDHTNNKCMICKMRQMFHKQSLINLKEYMESVINYFDGDRVCGIVEDTEEDIKELTKMIEKYK